MKQIALIFFALLILCKTGFCQDMQALNNDSLLHELRIAKEDTNKALLLIKIGNNYELNKPDSALYYYKASGDLSKKINYPEGVLKYIANYTAALNIQNKYEESLAMNLEAINLAQKINKPVRLAIAYNNTASSYYGLKNYEKCIAYFLKAKDLLEEINDQPKLVILYGNLAGIFNELKQDQKACVFGLKAIKISRDAQDNYALLIALVNTSNAFINLNKDDTALVLLKQARSLAKKLNDTWSLESSLVNMTNIYKRHHQYELMKISAQEALEASSSLKDNDGISKSLLFSGIYYLYTKDYTKAKEYAMQAMSVAQQHKLNEPLERSYLVLSDIELALGNVDTYLRYRFLNDSIQDLLINEQVLKNTEELEAKYSLNKKQAEIDNLNKEKKIQALTLQRRNILALVLTGTIIVLGIIGFLYHRNNQQKKALLEASSILQQQRINELEKEKKLLAAEAVLQGQEEERHRLAKDLHDGLGGILSGTKYAFSNMKNSLIITPENAEAFERSMAMLDKSILELRRVAHNMMPEALVKFGLDTALQDFCNSINQSGAVTIRYQSFDIDDSSIPQSSASVVYRVIQELINNILKHAAAKNALVQLVRKNDALSITVEDDGKGFDKNILQNSNGIGYLNLQNRVSYLNGTLDVETAENKGTSVNIEIPNINA